MSKDNKYFYVKRVPLPDCYPPAFVFGWMADIMFGPFTWEDGTASRLSLSPEEIGQLLGGN